MKKIDGNTFLMGNSKATEKSKDNDFPCLEVRVKDFQIDSTTVTNLEFRKFVDETRYITDAEKYGFSYVFFSLLSKEERKKYIPIEGGEWWYAVKDATWFHPQGSGSDIKDKMDFPVVHVSRNDALAYCKWANKRLPTEAEWEYAARGGLIGKEYPWGDNFLDNNNSMQMNIWKGEFAYTVNVDFESENSVLKVKSYEPNNFGLYDMTGNVWEWCLNPGYIEYSQFNQQSSKAMFDKYNYISDEMFAIRGGSFLCHDSYCKRYKVYSRNAASASTSSSNTGFRCVKDSWFK